jgi:putative FmdB family regulatory protein
MPTYDYECGTCDHKWELFQSITAKPVRKCPACGKSKARRLIGTGASVIFKGSGFYTTDYRSESYKQAAKAESEAASGKKAEGSGEAATTRSGEAGTTAPETKKKPGTDSPSDSKKKKSA